MCRERAFPNQQAAKKSPTVLACNYRTVGWGKCSHPVCCPALHSTLPTAAQVLAYTFQNPKGSYLSVRMAFTTMISRPLKIRLLRSHQATNEACSDHTKMGVVMPAYVATEGRIILNTGHRNCFPEFSCFSLCETCWIIPRLNHCAGGQPEFSCPNPPLSLVPAFVCTVNCLCTVTGTDASDIIVAAAAATVWLS